ncbi:MAG: carbohydrate kinase [Rhodobacteraceae bacterium]|nr:carbohydrate kinase [Paracoccaceae bacterium]
MSCVLGVDKGTTATKAVVFDAATGRVLGTGHQPTRPLHPRPGWHEEDMETTWGKVATCIRLAKEDAGVTGTDITGIGIAGHMGGLWALDAQGHPAGPAIAWPDARAAGMLEHWTAQGIVDEIYDISGNAPIPGVPMVLLGWLKRHDPARLDRIATLFCAKDYINYRLTGAIATDESDLSFFPCDIRTRAHSDRLFDRLGLTDLCNRLAPVLPTGATMGHVTEEAARETGLAPGTPVVTGAGDAVAAALGAGAVEPGQAVTVIGTSFMNNVTTDRPVMEPRGVGFLFLMPDGNWQRLMANTGGGALCLDWALDTFCTDRLAEIGKPALLDQIGREAEAVPPLSGGLIAHPYFNTSGMSAPRFEPHARGSLYGLDTWTGPAQIVRAVMEGVALSMAECYAALDVEVRDIRITGGGARSALWRRICAAAANRPLLRPEAEETGALGVALLAAVAAGHHPDIPTAAAAMIRMEGTEAPDPCLVPAYRDAYPLYRDLGRALSPLWQRRADLLSKQTRSKERP